jgi:hypothetical protein
MGPSKVTLKDSKKIQYADGRESRDRLVKGGAYNLIDWDSFN